MSLLDRASSTDHEWSFDRAAPFAWYASASFFEKAGAEEGKRRRIAGIASVEEEDQEGETILQDGIDWSYFLARGFLNDNHDKSIAGIVGYPEAVQRFRRGDALPNGELAKAACTWLEGYLLDNDPRADAIWKKGLALQGTPRALGFSIEGKSRARSIDGRTVIKSLVRHTAVTHVPVNASTRADLFFKSLTAVHRAAKTHSHEELVKAWDAFSKSLSRPRRRAPRLPRGFITTAQAIALVRERIPSATTEQARRLVEVAQRRRRTP